MKIKVSEATPLQLDCLVAQIEGEHVVFDGEVMRYVAAQFSDEGWYKPTEDWSQGGPIIEEAFIAVFSVETRPFEGEWAACVFRHQQEGTLDDMGGSGYAFYASELSRGPTPLIAAMRCFVASRMGDEVEVPEVLCM